MDVIVHVSRRENLIRTNLKVPKGSNERAASPIIEFLINFEGAELVTGGTSRQGFEVVCNSSSGVVGCKSASLVVETILFRYGNWGR